MAVSGTSKLLCVFAHPDDESYGPGGTIARCALEGVEVALLMFTCGEAGTIGVSKEIPDDELCRRRRGELAGACDALGIARHRVLGVPDRGVAAAGEEWAVAEIMREIRSFGPQVLLTFHHLGVSGHPDHIAVARYLAAAFDSVGGDGEPPLKLQEFGIDPEKAPLYRRPNLVPLKSEEIDTVIDVPDEAMDRKIEAIRRHVTQYDAFLGMEQKFDYRSVTRPECFHLRKTRLPRSRGVEHSLFEGISTR